MSCSQWPTIEVGSPPFVDGPQIRVQVSHIYPPQYSHNTPSTNVFYSTEIILSPLSDLHKAFADAQSSEGEGSKKLFEPSQTIPIDPSSGKVTIIIFSQDASESHLFVGTDRGFLAVYDTASLIQGGGVQPRNQIQLESNALREIVPNPGSEPNLKDLVAVVGDGKVILFNSNLEKQAGWQASDLMSQPIAGISFTHLSITL